MMKTEPVRTVLMPLVLACVAAAGQSFIDGESTRGILVAALGALVLGAQELARSYVTPTPKKIPVTGAHGLHREDGGYSLVEAVLVVFLILVILIVLSRFL